MSRLVFITQQVDPGHAALAATVPKIAALARRVDEVLVLAGGAAPASLPDNCRLRTFRAGTKAGRGLRFLAAIAPALLRRPDAVIAHMCPIYALLAAPLARPLGVPVVLWFTHWRASRELRLAERLSSAVASVDRRSFPLDSPKLHAIGHGVDLAEFRCLEPPPRNEELRVLALGRYTPVKGYDVVLRAARLALDSGLALRLRVFGPTLTEEERRHRAELQRLLEELALQETAQLEGPVPWTRVASLLAEADVLVNATRTGGADKVVYEAAAACRPVLASAPVFEALLPASLRFDPADPAGLARRLAELASLDPESRAALGRSLRGRVAESHSVETWAEGILAAAGVL